MMSHHGWVAVLAMNTQEFIIGFVSAVGGLLISLVALRKGFKADKVAEQVGVTDRSQAGTAKLFEDLNRLLDQTQEDNIALRDDAKGLRDEARAMLIQLKARDVEIGECRKRLYRYASKYGDNENGTTTT